MPPVPFEQVMSRTGSQEPLPEPAPRSKRKLIAAGVALLVVIGSIGYLLFPRTNSTAIALSFSKGESLRYHTDLSLNMTLSEGASTLPIDVKVSEDLGWSVGSVDRAGTATVLVTPSNVTATSDGSPLPLDPQPLTLTITRDGEVSLPNGLTLGSGSATGPMSSGANLSAILPSGSVRPGDSWSKSITENLLGNQISFTGHSTYVENQRLGGTNAAVVKTTSTIPLDVTIDLSKLLGAIAPSNGASQAIPRGTKATYNGQVSSTTTSWVDPSSRSILKSSSEGKFSFTISVTGLGAANPFAGGPISTDGSLSMSMTRG